VKLVDVNILVYAVNSDAPQHERSRRWLENALSGAETIGLAWSVLLAFLRITTRRGILERPMTAIGAIGYIDSWLRQPQVELVEPGPGHWTILRSLIATAGTAGNLTADAHLAALAIEGGWTLVSNDNDFRRFSGLDVLNPLSG
jgi:toxin-antitoxin system PIN domain toxin